MAEAACSAVMHPSDCWLDLGSGTGQLSRALRAAGAHVTSIDHDVAMLKFAGNGITASADQLPLADACMHGVIATSLLGCLDESLPTLREAFRVLRPGGHFVFTCTNAASVLLSINSIAVRSAAPRFRFYRAEKMKTDLRSVGFHVGDVQYFNCVLHIGRWLFPPARIAQRLDGWGVERLARNFLVVAFKPAL